MFERKMYDSRRRKEGKLRRHAVIIRHKVVMAVAFATTIFLICIENAKSFTVPISASNQSLNENAIYLLRSSKLAKRLKIDFHPNSNREYGTTIGLSVEFLSNYHRQKKSITSLRMAIGVTPSTSQPSMLDMKTSINAFGSWYDKLDPVARPYLIKDDVTDYTFTSPSDSWSTSLDDDYVTTAPSLNRPRMTSERSNPSPIRAIRRVAGWVLGIRPIQRVRGII